MKNPIKLIWETFRRKSNLKKQMWEIFSDESIRELELGDSDDVHMSTRYCLEQMEAVQLKEYWVPDIELRLMRAKGQHFLLIWETWTGWSVKGPEVLSKRC